jgi:hypothetical protein
MVRLIWFSAVTMPKILLGKRIPIAIRGSDVQLKFNRHDEEGVWL